MSPSPTSLNHIAIIPDGNRRWAKQRGMPAIMGHERAARHAMREIVDLAIQEQIPYLTFWLFSTENWQRDQQEVDNLMSLFRRGFSEDVKKLHEKGVKLKTIGDVAKFAPDIQKGVAEWREQTKDNTAITVTFALNYGGRDELQRAAQKMVKAAQKLSEEEAQKLSLGDFLDTAEAGLPDPDLIIRPGGEQRLSGLLPWQSVYAELYFTDTLMPDFGGTQFAEAIEWFRNRNRRFGK
jgi:undecaprenyl diphosphate synthase